MPIREMAGCLITRLHRYLWPAPTPQRVRLLKIVLEDWRIPGDPGRHAHDPGG